MANLTRLRRRALWARRRLFVGLALALGACDPGPLDYAGKRCSTERPCPSQWTCSGGTCHAEATASRVKNGTFEAGVAGWVVSHGTVAAVAPGHDSAGALQWRPDGTGESVLTLDAPVVETPVDGNWCAQAWVQNTDGQDVDFDIMRNFEVYDTDTLAANAGVWTKAEAKTLSLFTEPLSVQFRSSPDAGVRQLLVDDVLMWQDVKSVGCAVLP